MSTVFPTRTSPAVLPVQSVTHLLLPFAAGNFIYIALADLVPELKASVTPASKAITVAFFTLGLALLFGLAAWT